MTETLFIGGPIDGFLQKSEQKQDLLPTSSIWLVCDDTFRILHGEKTKQRSQLTSVAVYELNVSDRGSRYCFVGTVSRGDFATILRGKATGR
jgi:hypothetical protein